MRTTLKTKNGGLWARLTALMVALLMTTAQMKAQVAKIVETDITYSSVQEAINAASDGNTVRILCDIAENIVVDRTGMTITLDLNGKTLRPSKYEKPSPTEDFAFLITVKTPLIIDDSSEGKTGLITTGGTEFKTGGVYATANITLNNGTITTSRTGQTLSNGGGVYVQKGGTFTMNGGVITGCHAIPGEGQTTNGGGVYINDGASFVMNDGIISNNSSDKGGGVSFNGGNRTFTMTGGTITGNTAAQNKGGGVFMWGATGIVFNVGGTAKIYGNNGNNVYLDNENANATMTVNTAFAEGAQIYVTTSTAPTSVNPVAVTSNGTANDVQYFKSDNTQYATIYKDSKVKLAVIGDNVCQIVETSTMYTTIADAINALTEAGQTIQLISNVSLTEELSIQYNKNFTLDLNGYVLKQTASDASVISNGGTLTINDSRYGQDAATHYLAKNGNTYSLSDSPTDYVVKGGVITGGNDKTGGIHNSGTLTLNAGIICGNTTGSSSGFAGGLRNMGTFTMTGGEICYNYTEGIGGGLTADNKNKGTTVSGGRIHHNTATSGGGVFVFGENKMTMTGGEVSGNTASNCGGIRNNGNTTVGGTAKVTGNTATSFAPNIGIAMEDATLTISTETPLAPDAMFGVTKGTQYYYEIIGGQLTTNGTANDAKYFTSDTDSYIVAYNSAGYLELVAPVCKNTTTNVKYATVQQAIDALTETGQTIQLISNVSLTKKIEIANNKNFTLDLNGYVLKQTNTHECVIDNWVTLTIIDSGIGAKHYYTVNSDGLWVWDDNNTSGTVNFENLTERPAANSVVCINGGAITGGKTGVRNHGSATLSFNGGTITGNNTAYGGGGINNQTGTLTINGGTISGNIAQYGGGISNDGGTITINGGTIFGNTAQYGGGMHGSLNFSQDFGTITINGGTISGNTAQYGGGILDMGVNYIVSGNVNITGNTQLIGETDSNLCLTAGVIYEIYGGTPPIVTIDGLTNEANIGVSVYDVSIVDESISSAVGVFATNASETDVQYFTADDKRTYIEFVSETGKLKLSHDPETIYVTNNSDYETDETPIEGSLRHAIANAIEGDTVKFDLAESDRTIFIENPYATKSIIIDGGSGITIDGGNNQMTYGMALGSCNTTLKNITFQNVKSVEGCIEIAYSDAVLTNCVFKDNTVSNGNLGGGALFIAESKVTINNSLFAGNSSQVNGGAITAATMSNPTDVTLNNCTFTANSVGTGYDGSAIYAITLGNKGSSRASALLGEDKISSKFAGLVKDVKVINAKAHRGGEVSCNVTLNNTIVVGNTGGNYEIYSEKGCTITANNVLGTTSNWKGVTATGTIEYDSEKQLFEDAGNGDYHIIPESQAVDAGDNSKVPASLTTDLEGNNRIVNGKVDLGCYETPAQEVAINIYDNPMGYGEVKIKDNTTGYYLDEDGRQHIKIGTSVTIETTPSGDYAFQGWFHKGTNNYFSKTQKFTFEATEDLELEARFTDQVIWVRVKKGN